MTEQATERPGDPDRAGSRSPRQSWPTLSSALLALGFSLGLTGCGVDPPTGTPKAAIADAPSDPEPVSLRVPERAATPAPPPRPHPAERTACAESEGNGPHLPDLSGLGPWQHPVWVKQDPDGRVTEIKLQEAEQWGGWLIRGTILLHPNGRIKQVQLAEARQWGEVWLRASSPVQWDAEGRVRGAVLAGPQPWGLYTLDGGPVKWHENGRLAEAVLVEPVTWQGRTCKGKAAWDERGELTRCHG